MIILATKTEDFTIGDEVIFCDEEHKPDRYGKHGVVTKIDNGCIYTKFNDNYLDGYFPTRLSHVYATILPEK